MGENYERDLYETICRSSGIEDPHQTLDLTHTDMFTIEEMATNPAILRFLQMVIAMSGAKRVLEIGAFVGLSTIYFAQAVPSDGVVVSIEKFDHFAEIARENFKRNGVENKINLIEGDAAEVIGTLPKDEPFDLIFIDGDKGRYKDYFIAADQLISPTGVILVDDCFFHGDALNAQAQTEKGEGVRDFLDYASQRTDYLRSAVPLANGIMFMRKIATDHKV